MRRLPCRTRTSAWGNEDTQELIDILAKYDVKATFFLVGEWVDKYPESVQALWDAGMEIGNHSNDHPHMAELSEKKILDEVGACNEKIAAITGESPTLFRCPYGEYDNEVITTVGGMGMYTIQWNVERSHTKERRTQTNKTRDRRIGRSRVLRPGRQKLPAEKGVLHFTNYTLYWP